MLATLVGPNSAPNLINYLVANPGLSQYSMTIHANFLNILLIFSM